MAEIIAAVREAGLDVWIDQEGIPGATFWPREIVEAITECSIVLFFASRQSCTSSNVSKELALASEEGKPILPVFIEAADLPSELRFQIAGLQHIKWHEDRDLALRQMISVLETHSPRSSSRYGTLSSSRLRSRRGRHWVRPILAALAMTAVGAMVTYVVAHRTPPRAGAAADGTTNGPADPLQRSAQSHPMEPASYRLQDAYYVETVTQSAEYKPYIGIRVRYKMLVTQNAQSLSVLGEKIGEVVDGQERTLSGRAKTPVRLSGHLDTHAIGSPLILLNGQEGSTSRSDLSTLFELRPRADGRLAGTFKSTAANASGTAMWIPEQQWLKTSWRSR